MIHDSILEAAARAAAKAEDDSNWDDEPDYYRNGWVNRIAPALEAAAPHMEEVAYSRGFDDGHRAGQESMEPE